MLKMNDLPVVPDFKWVEREDSQLGVRYLDVRSFTTTMISTSADQKLAQKFVELRKSNGEHVREILPDPNVHIDCQLMYPHQGQTRMVHSTWRKRWRTNGMFSSLTAICILRGVGLECWFTGQRLVFFKHRQPFPALMPFARRQPAGCGRRSVL